MPHRLFRFAAPSCRSLVAAMLLAAGLAAHATASGPSSAALAGLNVAPVGSGVLSWFGIDVYEAFLFTESGRFDGQGVDQTVALELRYRRNIPASRLVDRTRKEWNRLDGKAELPEAAVRESWLKQVGSFWPDIKSGDLIVTVVSPGGPARFYTAGEFIGEVRDPAFGPAFLGIWLHPDSSRPDLRDQLVGAAR
jgi:hypothetical protein